MDKATVDDAAALLRRLGAATPEGTDLAATPWGHTVYRRLVEIEQDLDNARRRHTA